MSLSPSRLCTVPSLLNSPKSQAFNPHQSLVTYRVTMLACRTIVSLIFIFSVAYFVGYSEASPAQGRNQSLVLMEGSGEETPMVPLIEQGKTKLMMMMNVSRRRLGSFQICALCTCCGGAKGVCLASPCCYAINCNIPNRPFGFCSFIPKTCNCFGCHL